MKRTTMKRLFFASVFAALPLLQAAEAPKIESPVQKSSYAIGYDMSRNLKRQGIDLDLDSFLAGLKTGLSGGAPALTEEQMREEFTALQNRAREAMMKARTEASAKNKEEG